MAFKNVEAGALNRAIFEIANAVKEEIKDAQSFEAVSKRIMDAHGIPEASREELIARLPRNWSFYPRYERDQVIMDGLLKALVADPDTTQKVMHMALTEAVDQAQFTENLDAFLALAKPAEVRGQPPEAEVLATLLDRLEQLAAWKDGGLDPKRDAVAKAAFKNLAEQTFSDLERRGALEPSVFEAYGALAAVVDKKDLEKEATRNLEARIAAEAEGRSAVLDAPAFLAARTHRVAEDGSPLMTTYLKALAKETKDLDQKGWEALDVDARYAAQLLAGPPKGVAADAARSLSDLVRLIDVSEVGQLKPALSAFAKQLKDRNFVKGFDTDVIGLTRAILACGEAGVKVDDKLATRVKEQTFKTFLASIKKGVEPNVVASVASELAKLGWDQADVFQRTTSAMAVAVRQRKVAPRATSDLLESALKGKELRPFAEALAESLINEIITSKKEATFFYRDRVQNAVLIPTALWKPVIARLAKEQPADGDKGPEISNGLWSMERNHWLPKSAVYAYLAGNEAGAHGLELYRSLLENDDRVLFEEKNQHVAGFGRDGDTYYLQKGNAIMKVGPNGEDRGKFCDADKWRAQAIRFFGDQVYLLNDLNGAGWIAVHDKETGEKIRRRQLPRPVNHAADPSAAVTDEGWLVFPEHKHGKADYVVSVSPEFDNDNIQYRAQPSPRGFQASAVAVHGKHVFAGFYHDGKSQLQITRYELPHLDNGKELLPEFVRTAGYGGPRAMWFLEDRLLVADGGSVRVFEIDGDAAKPVRTLPYPGLTDVRPRDDGGLDLAIRNNAFDGAWAGTRLVRLSAEEAKTLFLNPLAED